ncbi:MAG: DUF3850 domain-containing protein [Lachnospiraceae bacterium]|nr:DUF3850 domain-containing protein [Lachnospiraceae bacterium]
MYAFHELKIDTKYYADVVRGLKTFELRKMDRDYKIGDMLVLYEFDREIFTGRMFTVKIVYILKDVPEYGLIDGYGILGIEVVK